MAGIEAVWPRPVPYSGSRNDYDDYKCDKTGFRLVEFQVDQVEELGLAARKPGGTIATLMMIAGATAYKRWYLKSPLDQTNLILPLNARYKIQDRQIQLKLHGGATHYITTFGFKLKDDSLFWGHVGNYKRIIH